MKASEYSDRTVRKLRKAVVEYPARRLNGLGGSVETRNKRVNDAAYNQVVNSGVDPDVADCFFGRV